ncbi:hypothetical protein [Legionella rowbothamii]|uniref:hypothetical protein n=1 Tax=Legionella rowbothamii TaxID=96229 RepID=UPI001056D1F8|nr:hypothetical protein [Legionella rowbothamii]
MSFPEYNNLLSEINRLSSMSQFERESEGVYAENSQLSFLLKKLNSSKNNYNKLKGIEHFVSDIASSGSKILELLDDYLEIIHD